jgi:toxin ParE1/3/4
MKIIAHPEIYYEMEYYRSWYEEKAERLGTDFLKEVDYAIKRICESPQTWPWYDKDLEVRKFLIHRFPFALLYKYKRDQIQIIAVADQRREPGYWKDRLTDFLN